MAQRHIGVGAVIVLALAAAGAAEARAPVAARTVSAVRATTVVTSQVRAHAVSVATTFRARATTPDVAPLAVLILTEHDRADPWTRAPADPKKLQPLLALDVHDPWSGEEVLLPTRERLGLDARDPWSGEPASAELPVRETKHAMLLRSRSEPASADDL